METIILEILAALRVQLDEPRLSDRDIQAIVRAHNGGLHDNKDHFAKKNLLPFYLRVKSEEPERWGSWNIEPQLEKRLLATLQVKPRRTASGVATITVITKPHACAGACLYCPNDVRMPKSYLHNEPACQRAERNYFDPYLQVISRARALHEMGHNTQKLEIIVLGGSFTDYPESYQRWFIAELFRAANNIDAELEAITASTALQVAAAPGPHTATQRRAFYAEAGISNSADALAKASAVPQKEVDEGKLSYNDAVALLYGKSPAWRRAAGLQDATWSEINTAHRENEATTHRIVGLVVETRPDTATPARLATLRALGCTKIQMGIQSTDETILAANNRAGVSNTATELARLFGFKLHTHFMANLAGATPDLDKADYARFIRDYHPDEVKLYPCALVGGTGLVDLYNQGAWRPYTDEELLDVLSTDMRKTPAYCRVSRMIRDIGAQDILVGNKKTNLRQMVDQKLEHEGACIQEIRWREINNRMVTPDELALEDVAYDTPVSTEHFLQWVTPDGHIAGFLRLSLPQDQALAALQNQLLAEKSTDAESAHSAAQALTPGSAMIREVHVYGKAANIGAKIDGAQHTGLGRTLVARACDIAAVTGYSRINVISAIGTRAYYRALDFSDCGLYLQKPLQP